MRKTAWIILITILLALPFMAQEPLDRDRLGMAIEYFQSGKYHEALLLFEKLDKEYTLNPRYKAFMGICFYHEWLYEEACDYLDKSIPQLESFAPHERSVYYYAAGESHFQLQQYQDAITYYEKALTVCYDNEKGDILYRLGLCHMFLRQWQEAYDSYNAALDKFIAFRDTPDMQARIHQTGHMMKGCEEHLKKSKGEANISAPETDSPDIKLPTLTTPTDSVPAEPNRVDTSRTLPDSFKEPVIQGKDTIRNEVPNTINIQDLFQRQVEIKD